jgi:hypothetical protein
VYKKIICLSLTLFVSQVHYASDLRQQKQLRLHFDVNKTIIATDAVQDKNLDTTINGIIAEYTRGPWDGKNIQSYYAYITDHIAQENPELSKTDEEFKSKRSECLKAFPEYLKQCPECLARYEREKTQMLHVLAGQKMAIFPSFYKTIEWLDTYYPQKYSIYLRTFGTDLPEVVAAIHKNTPLRFINHETDLTVKTPRTSLLHALANPDGNHWALRDDYEYWKSNGFQAAGGKPFWVNLNDPNSLPMFFDDNADDPDKPIIDPCRPNNESTQKLLKTGHIVAVNPKEAILDNDYFINKIKRLL